MPRKTMQLKRKGNSSNYNKLGEERNLESILIPKSDPG